MARGRMLSKSLSTSEKYARLNSATPELAEFCQALFPLLNAHTDDFGRAQGDVFTVKMQIHPTSPRSEADFDKALVALHDVGLIERYQVKGKWFLSVPKFDQHQSGLHKRTRSAFPPVPEDSRNPQEHSGTGTEIPGQQKGRELKRTERKRRERK